MFTELLLSMFTATIPVKQTAIPTVTLKNDTNGPVDILVTFDYGAQLIPRFGLGSTGGFGAVPTLSKVSIKNKKIVVEQGQEVKIFPQEQRYRGETWKMCHAMRAVAINGHQLEASTERYRIWNFFDGSQNLSVIERL